MAGELVRIEMLRHVAQYIHVIDLEMGRTYELTPASAQALIDAGAAKAAPASSRKLEAAALAAPSRR